MKGINQETFDNQNDSVWEEVYKKYLKEGDVIYDIGAYRGVTAVGFAKLGFKVHAFEGSPNNISYLMENSKGYDITVHPVGLHIRNYSVKTNFNDCNFPMGQHPEQDVNYVVLDEYIDHLPKPKLIKVDIEGMESVVFLRATKLLTETKPLIQLSLHPNQGGYNEHYPGWVPKEWGGFDFSSLSKDYVFTDRIGNFYSSLSEFKEYLLIPK